MIELENLTRIFCADEIETTALNSVNLVVNKGEFVAIMGPSGCGKSTLLSILGMLDSPTSGSYKFNGKEISDYSERKLAKLRKASLGFVFQSFHLINELSVYDNVALPLQYQGMSAQACRLRVNTILKRMGIDHRASHFPQQLSGGQQQRVAVARALVIEPLLVLADEPTGNLDSSSGAEVMSLLCELNREGTTVIMVTHSENEGSYADRIVRLLDGQVIYDHATDAEFNQAI